MRIDVVGPWLILGVGIVALLAAIAAPFLRPGTKNLWMMWVFGFGLAGVGIHGPVFLNPYSEFLKVALSAPTEAGYAELFATIGSDEVPEAYAEAGLALALQRPIENMSTLLEKAIADAPPGAGKTALEEAKVSLQGQQQAAERLVVASEPGPAGVSLDFRRLDPATRFHVADSLLRLPPTELERRALSRRELERMRSAAVAPR